LSSKSVQNELVVWLPNLRAFAISLCGEVDRADDLVQETLLKAWKHLDTFKEGTNLRAWLFTILRNTFLSDLRGRRDEISLDAEPDYAGRLKVLPEQYGRLDSSDMQRALGELNPEQRAAIILVGAEGFSYEETAAICGCKVGTVKSRVNRARQRLLELLGDDTAVRVALPSAAATAARPASRGNSTAAAMESRPYAGSIVMMPEKLRI
jgi:RNA polymerase sigma-70 factor, ECF subfamily